MRETVTTVRSILAGEHCRERIAAFRAAGVTTPLSSSFYPDEAVQWRTFEALAPG